MFFSGKFGGSIILFFVSDGRFHRYLGDAYPKAAGDADALSRGASAGHYLPGQLFPENFSKLESLGNHCPFHPSSYNLDIGFIVLLGRNKLIWIFLVSLAGR